MDAEAIRRSLEGSGLRCTPQRYAVMAFLMEHNRHPTAAEIFEAVNRVDPRCSRATTYNNLQDLVQAGLVREVAVEGRVAYLVDPSPIRAQSLKLVLSHPPVDCSQ